VFEIILNGILGLNRRRVFVVE